MQTSHRLLNITANILLGTSLAFIHFSCNNIPPNTPPEVQQDKYAMSLSFEKGLMPDNDKAWFLVLKVTEGTVHTKDFTLKVEKQKSFDSQDFKDIETILDADKTKLTKPYDGGTLQELVGVQKLTKGDKIIYPIQPKAGANLGYAKGLACQADLSILDKSGKVVAGPITVKWSILPAEIK